MNIFLTPAPVTVTCHKRITPFLEEEIRAIGYAVEDTFVTGVRITATVNDCIRLNLRLRCASQVLYSLKKFSASTPDEIYEEAVQYPWEDLIPDPGYVSVTSNVSTLTINNSMYANLRIKDAIIDRLRQTRGTRPSSGSELSGTVIHLYWKDNSAELFADTSGSSLARHGYRKIPGLAPMLESLAAATIYAGKWDQSSPFVNPMCGSGTIAIEAAMIATQRYPGLFRTNYAFMHLANYDEALYREEDALLEKIIIEKPGLQIIASDIDGRAIENAKKNAIAAGVSELIEFIVCDFKDTPVPEGASGVLYLNPEYGDRMGEIGALEGTYAEIGDFMKKRCNGYTGYVFTGNLELAKKIGLKAKRRLEFYTSKIDCRLLEYELYKGTRNNVDNIKP